MSRTRRWFLVAAVVCAALLPVVVRVHVDAAAAVREGDEAASRGDVSRAIRWWSEAARLHLPGGPAGRDAIARLSQRASSAEREGDLDTARRALEALRTASLGTRWLSTPRADSLDDLERRLAALYARLGSDGGSPPRSAALYLQQLAHRSGPALAPALFALAGFAGFLAAASAFVLRGLDPSLRPRRRPAILWGALALAAFALFALALRVA